MSAEMPLIDIRPDHWAIVRRILQKHVPQYAVWAFGSRTKWSAKEYSDLDLAIITDKPLPLSISAALDEDFSESDLPWKVDVVDWATTSEVFRKVIAQDKVVLQISDSGSGWHETTLGKAFEVNPFRPLKRNTVTPFVPMDVLPVNARAIDRIEAREYTGSGMRFQNGDTLIARITPCLENGKTAFVSGLRNGEVAHGSTEYIVLSGVPGKSDSLFGYYLSRSPVFRSYALGHMEGTSGRQRVPASAVENFPLLLPPIEEQRAIAHILGTLDDKIELNRKQNETLEAMARALFKAWFVDFEPVRAKMEGRWQRGQSLPGLPAHLYDLFPDRLVASELGEIPEGWEVEAYSDAVEIIGGGTPKTSVDEYWNGEIPWFSVVDTPASSDVFVVSTEKSITQAGFENSSVKMAEKGVTIISARGTVGNLAIAGREMTFNQSCYALRGKSGFGSYFVFLSAQHMVEQLKAMAHGSVFSTITRQTFDAVKVVRPSEALLFQFERVIASLFDAILGNVNESRTLAQLRDTLLPKLISGELRVFRTQNQATL